MGEASISLLSDCLQSWSWWDLNRILTGAGNDWSTSPPSTRKLNGRRGDLFSNFQEKNQFKGRRKLCHRNKIPPSPISNSNTGTSKLKMGRRIFNNLSQHICEVWGLDVELVFIFPFSLPHICVQIGRCLIDWICFFVEKCWPLVPDSCPIAS